MAILNSKLNSVQVNLFNKLCSLLYWHLWFCLTWTAWPHSNLTIDFRMLVLWRHLHSSVIERQNALNNILQHRVYDSHLWSFKTCAFCCNSYEEMRWLSTIICSIPYFVYYNLQTKWRMCHWVLCLVLRRNDCVWSDYTAHVWYHLYYDAVLFVQNSLMTVKETKVQKNSTLLHLIVFIKSIGILLIHQCKHN